MRYQARLHRLGCMTSHFALIACFAGVVSMPAGATLAAGNVPPAGSTEGQEDEPETLEVRASRHHKNFSVRLLKNASSSPATLSGSSLRTDHSFGLSGLALVKCRPGSMSMASAQSA